MTRPLLPALAAMATLALPAQAFDLENMTDAERDAFRTEIRDYLLENPEVIMEAVAVLEQRETAAQAESDVQMIEDHAEAIFNDDHSWDGGNPEGDLTLVEFMDYRCGYCRRAAPDVDDLVEFDGNIRFVIKEFPILGEQSMLSSRFAIATLQLEGDEAYKAAHDALITFAGDIDETSLTRIGETLGLDTDAILARMDSPEVTEVIAENHQLAKSLGISGTPSFVMGDQMLRGYVPREGMEEIVAEIRSDS